jgi:hypothetical protein
LLGLSDRIYNTCSGRVIIGIGEVFGYYLARWGALAGWLLGLAGGLAGSYAEHRVLLVT